MKNNSIDRHGVSAWLFNMGYEKLADMIMDEERFPSVQIYNEEWRKEHYKISYNQGFLDGYKMAVDYYERMKQ